MKYVQNQGFQGISWDKPMVSTQDPALVVTPGLYQYNATLEQMVLIYQIINLKKQKLQFSEETQTSSWFYFFKEKELV